MHHTSSADWPNSAEKRVCIKLAQLTYTMLDVVNGAADVACTSLHLKHTLTCIVNVENAGNTQINLLTLFQPHLLQKPLLQLSFWENAEFYYYQRDKFQLLCEILLYLLLVYSCLCLNPTNFWLNHAKYFCSEVWWNVVVKELLFVLVLWNSVGVF